MSIPRLLTAMITPFKENLEVDYDQARQLAAYLVENGSEGIVVCGTTGESPTLSDRERVELFKAVQSEVGSKVQVWAGVGTNSTWESIELGKMAVKVGVYGIMVVTPYYNKPTQEGLYRHYQEIARNIPLPVMMYNIPGRTAVNMLPETVERLARIENIVALKEASGNLDQLSQLKNILPDDFLVYSGDDSLTLPMMALGAVGVVSVASHLVGPELRNMIDAFLSGQAEKARQIHNNLMDLFKVLFITTNPIPLKEALRMTGRDNGVLRLPLCEAGEKERQEIEKVLRRHKLI